MNTKNHFLIFISAILLLGCEQILLPEAPETDPHNVFEECWTFADHEYSYFELKSIDWNQVRRNYEPKIRSSMTDRALFDTLADMLFQLRDGHVNLFADFDVSRNWQWNLDYPSNFDYNLLERAYWKNEQRLTQPFITYDFGDIGYIYYSSFARPISDGTMSLIIDEFKDHKGIIIDVRDNGGGSVSNVARIVSRFIEQELVYGQERHKKGPGHQEFTDWADLTISPNEDLSVYKGKIVVLTNRSCYSACNDFVSAMSALPQVTLIGDQTGGGGGLPSQTQLSNGWTLRVSSSQTLDHQGQHIEEGIAPYIKVDLVDGNNKDEILEEALDFLRN